MALTYDLKTDLRYLAGEEKGIVKGEARGILKGEVRKQKEMISEMFKKLPNFSIEQIAEIAKVSVDYAQDIVKEMKKA